MIKLLNLNFILKLIKLANRIKDKIFHIINLNILNFPINYIFSRFPPYSQMFFEPAFTSHSIGSVVSSVYFLFTPPLFCILQTLFDTLLFQVFYKLLIIYCYLRINCGCFLPPSWTSPLLPLRLNQRQIWCGGWGNFPSEMPNSTSFLATHSVNSLCFWQKQIGTMFKVKLVKFTLKYNHFSLYFSPQIR